MALTYSLLTKEQGQGEITKKDDYINGLDEYNLKEFHGKNTKEEYLEKAKNAVDFFEYKHRQRLNKIMASLQKRWEELGLPSLHVNFVITSGLEMNNLAYTRGNTIFFPRKYFSPWLYLKPLVAHEIFHVLSRNNPELRKRAYEVFGFFEVPEVKASKVLLNPDAPINNQAVEVWTLRGRRRVVPLIRSRENSWFLPFSFVVVDVDTKEELSVYKTSLFLKTGLTTQYLAHVEEISADFFKILFVGKWFHNPWKLWKFKRAILKKT